MNKLLFDEAPLVVQPTLASIIGLNEAIILQQIHYWVKKSKDGWIYNTYDQWQKQFPFYSEATIKRTITSLKKRGVVIVDQRSKSDWNRVNHYTIDYEVMSRLTESNCDDRTGQNDLIESSKMTPSFYRTETTTETTTDIKRSRANVECPKSVSIDVWEDYLKIRKAKKAPITRTALNGIIKEADKAGLGIEKVLTMCCERGWIGFKAEWIANKNRSQGNDLSLTDIIEGWYE